MCNGRLLLEGPGLALPIALHPQYALINPPAAPPPPIFLCLLLLPALVPANTKSG